MRNCVRDDAELRAFTTGMNETNSRRFCIDNVNRAAVGNVNAEHDTALIGNDSIAGGEFAAPEAVD